MITLDPLSHGIHNSGSWFEKSNDHTATVTAVLPRLVQQLQDPRCAMVACKAGLFSGGAICDVLAVRAWLRWHGRVSSASTEETLRRSSQSCRSSMTAAATHGHKNVAAVLPRVVQQLQDPRCAMAACKAGLFTGVAICDVLVPAVRAWLHWHGRVSSASTEETSRRSSRSCRSSMTAAATQGHENVVVALLLAFGACVGCTGWVRRRAAVV
eukprot:CAMPEP_0172777824 /NCGR_PEP_ID=MMETSP1074-20121228/201600_1 /TAXON_ID=2916 /ORGANISM="Ceratium fusus, Strain PA161109" /LENGTH=211 /DNA_ID=CAMNT_0013614753 /DNA_START=37 /DNA_END=668 /DNA_ORIENTATION=+